MALQDHVGRREEEDRRATRARKAPWAPLEREVETGSQEFVEARARQARTAPTGSKDLVGQTGAREREARKGRRDCRAREQLTPLWRVLWKT